MLGDAGRYLLTNMNLTTFDIDPDRFAALKECTESYEVGTPDAEWPNNILSRRTIVYESGVIARDGDHVNHNVDPDELDRCKSLATTAREMIGDIDVGMGSESGDQFFPFFICNNADAAVSNGITGELIRERFGGTIFPPATITAEPLEATGVWWNEATDWVADSEDDDKNAYLGAWQRLIDWFKMQPELSDATFVRIGDREALWNAESGDMPEGTEVTGCVLPRMAVALTKSGSIVGIFGYTVQS